LAAVTSGQDHRRGHNRNYAEAIVRTALTKLLSKLTVRHVSRLSLVGMLLAGVAAVSTSAAADTTNRALQVSPVPGIFVGGVGLLCAPQHTVSNTEDDRPEFLLLTKNRETLGWANLFNDDDISYQMLAVAKTPDYYSASQDSIALRVHRKDLTLNLKDTSGASATASTFTCMTMSISDLHKAATSELRLLLSGNKI
jgi:hypothetical protein